MRWGNKPRNHDGRYGVFAAGPFYFIVKIFSDDDQLIPKQKEVGKGMVMFFSCLDGRGIIINSRFFL
jgi:hypothetical protein